MSVPGSPRVLVLGARGMLGADIVGEAPPDASILLPAGGRVDVRDRDAVARAIETAAPEVVVNCTAYTRVDRAEIEVEAAHAVNARAVGLLGDLCARTGARMVHFSTDYVFPGDAGRPYTEADVPRPLGVYGRSKLEGEQLLRASGARSLVIRTQWLFGLTGSSFPRTMWERALAGDATSVVADQRGCPTSTVALARATWALIARGTEGIVHASGSGGATWHELAREIFARARVPELLSPCTTSEYPASARRPADSRLDCARLAAEVGPLPAWRDSLHRFLDQLGGESDAR